MNNNSKRNNNINVMNNMKNNQGFSLVELIIVIALMTIIVGIAAPLLYKYIEKSKVANDESLLGSLEVAITYAVADTDVNLDSASQQDINKMVNGVINLEDLDSSTILYEHICDTLGWSDLNWTTYTSYISSEHSEGNDCQIKLTYVGNFNNPVKIWINTTDCSGQKNTTYKANTVTDADFLKVIHIN